MTERATWTRLEATAVTDTLDVGLRAEVADPLWLVGRQWQLGELNGSDGGSPLLVDTVVSWQRLSRLSCHPGPVDLRHTPVEPLAEREPQLRALPDGTDEDPGDWAARARAGRSLVRMLRAAGCTDAADRAGSLASFPTGLDPGAFAGDRDRRYAYALAGQGCDAARVLALADDAIPAGDAAAAAVLAEWRREVEREWGIAEGSGDPRAWIPERLEHDLTLSTLGESDGLLGHPDTSRAVRAADYDGSGLDWHAFDTRPHDGLGPLGEVGEDLGLGSTARTVLATRLSYPGQPDDRFFAFEDASVRLGAPDAGPTDLVKLVVSAFATVAGPDWLLVPVELPVGCLAGVTSVQVRDTFGVMTQVQQSTGAGRQFQLSGAAADLLVLPPAVAVLQSPPREEVLLQRDEGADLVWAIEHVVRGRAGGPVDRRSTSDDFEPPHSPLPDGSFDVVWRVQTPVPPSWLPLVVVADDSGALRRRLVPARLLDTPTGALPAPASRVLAGVRTINDEEVPRTGVRVTVHDRLVRGADGSTYVWRARQKRPGRGEAASGLRFDDAASR